MRGARSGRGSGRLAAEAPHARRSLQSASRLLFFSLFFFFFSFLLPLYFCLETKAQLMDSWRSEDPLPGTTLMHRCPISAFNWCPGGPAARSRRPPLPRLRAGKVKFTAAAAVPGDWRRGRGRRGRTGASRLSPGGRGEGSRSPGSLSAGPGGSAPGRAAEDDEPAGRKAQGACIVWRSPLHVGSHLVNNGCLLTRMRRLNNSGGRLNTVPHRAAASRAAHRPGQERLAGWRPEEGGDSLQGALAERSGGPRKVSTGPTPRGVEQKNPKRISPVKCG